VAAMTAGDAKFSLAMSCKVVVWRVHSALSSAEISSSERIHESNGDDVTVYLSTCGVERSDFVESSQMAALTR